MIVHRKNTMTSEDQSARMEAILARDQRTTSHRVLDRATQICAPTSTAVPSSQRSKPQEDSNGRYAEATTTTKENDWISARRCLQYVSHFLSALFQRQSVRSICVIVISTTWLRLSCLLTLVVTANSGPLMSLDNRWDTTPKWVNPCGLSATTMDDTEGDSDVAQLQDEQLLQQIVVQARTALVHAQLFVDDFVAYTFKSDLSDVMEMWYQQYEWLPGKKKIPKELGERLKQEYLDKLELDPTLIDAYEFMQTFAVCLEQTVWDQEPDSKFRKELSDTEYKLRAVLCELQVALVERGVTPRPDVTRSVMPDNIRAMHNETDRYLRDWVVIREYMNALEYVVQAFEYLKACLMSHF